MKKCGLLMQGCPLENWSKGELIKLIVRLVLFPHVTHIEKTKDFVG